MIKKTKGIVINYIKYRDTSIIVRIFTRELGLKSYIINGIRSAKSKSKIAFFQPLSLLDLVVYHKEGASLNRISETKLSYPFRQIPFDFYRSGIAIFMGEVLGKAIHEDYYNTELYDFLEETITYLDQSEGKLSIFPLSFLLEISGYLGFAPANSREFYGQLPPEKKDAFSEKKADLLDGLIHSPFDAALKINTAAKRALMDDLLQFFRIHLDSFSEIKSVKVLRGLDE